MRLIVFLKTVSSAVRSTIYEAGLPRSMRKEDDWLVSEDEDLWISINGQAFFYA